MKKIWSIVLVLVMLASAAALPALAATGGTADTHSESCPNGNHSYVHAEEYDEIWWEDGGNTCIQKKTEYYFCSFCSACDPQTSVIQVLESHSYYESLDDNGFVWQICRRCGHTTSF